MAAATTWFRNLPVWAKAGVALTGGLLIGSATFFVLQASGLGRSLSKDGRSRRQRQEDAIERVLQGSRTAPSLTDGVANNKKPASADAARRVLVLGLSGAGKSSILARLTKVEKAAAVVTDKSNAVIKPTDGFSVICMQTTKGTLNIWEIGGTDKNRAYWENFVRDTDLLVYVVDSTDDDYRLDVAVTEFKKLIADARLDAVSIILLANKQDAPGAKNQFDIEKLFGCKNGLVGGHKVRVLGTRAAPDLPTHPSVGEAERLIITMSAK